MSDNSPPSPLLEREGGKGYDVVVLGGSGGGADTAVLMKPAYAASMFSLKIKEILCMPRG